METIPAKHILHRNKSTEWFGCDHTMNLYRGCCHGCIYCDSRSDCYHNDKFDQVRVKADALRILRDDLARKVRPALICTGSMSDPYNPFETKLLYTRRSLELTDAFQCGVAIATKGDCIVRDIDILTSIQTHSPAICKITLTTLDEELAKKIEPQAPSPARRLEAVRQLAAAGLFTGILLMPVLPFLEDCPENITNLLEAVADAGAKFVYPFFGVTMRQGQREYFLQHLDKAFPDGENLSQRYLARYGDRYVCTCPNSSKLWALFSQTCRELGLLYEMKHIVSAATRPYEDRQLRFF